VGQINHLMTPKTHIIAMNEKKGRQKSPSSSNSHGPPPPKRATVVLVRAKLVLYATLTFKVALGLFSSVGSLRSSSVCSYQVLCSKRSLENDKSDGITSCRILRSEDRL
jgi:hypothetical protein